MRVNRSSRWLVGGLVTAGIVAAAVALGGGGPGSASAQPTRVTDYMPGPVVARWAAEAGITDLRALARAGTADHDVVIISGKNRAGVPCWTAVASGGRVAAPFRCGAPEPTPIGALSVFPRISGSAGSIAADSVALVGFVRADVASVEALLVDGTTRQLTLANRSFSYASTSATDLPTAIRAYNASGRLIGEQTIHLESGPDR